MYKNQGKDKVTESREFPYPAAGATDPIVISDEHKLILSYRVAESDREWSHPNATDLGRSQDSDLFSIIRFKGVWSTLWTPINDEGLGKHPLSKHGLSWYSVFEIQNSSFCKAVGANPNQYFNRKHLIFTFKDSTFECIVESYEVFLCRKDDTAIFEEMCKVYTIS